MPAGYSAVGQVEDSRVSGERERVGGAQRVDEDQQQVGADGGRLRRRARAGGRARAGSASALPVASVGVARRRGCRAGWRAAASRATHGSSDRDRHQVAAQHRHRRQRQPVGLAAQQQRRRPASASRSAITSSSTVSSWLADVGRAGQRRRSRRRRGPRRGPSPCPARSRAGPARGGTRTRSGRPSRSTLPPGTSGCGRCRGRCTRPAPAREKLRRKTVSVPVSPSPMREARGHAVAEAGEQVVVDAPVDPGAERGVGDAVAHVRDRGSRASCVSSAVRSASGRSVGHLQAAVRAPASSMPETWCPSCQPDRPDWPVDPVWLGLPDTLGSSVVPSLTDLVRSHTDLDDGRRRVAAAAAGRLADHRRPLLRRPGAVAARPRGQRASGRAAQMRPDHRPHGVRRRRRRHVRPGRPPADARLGVRRRGA